MKPTKNIVSFLAIFFLLVHDVQSSQKCGKMIDNNFCIDENYDSNSPPPEKPLKVVLPITIQEISKVDDLSLTIGIDFFVYMEWKDSRISYKKANSTEELTLGAAKVKDIFIPDLYIYQMVTFERKSVLDDVQGLYLNSDNTLVLYFEGKLELKCLMLFEDYPFDSQNCRFMIGSSAYTNHHMTFDGTFQYREKEQRAIQYMVSTGMVAKNETLLVAPNGNYSVYGLDIFLRRVRAPFMWQFYIPSFMMYIITLIAYLIPLDCGERGSVLITLLLVFASMFIAINSSSPKAHSLTALDLWMIACIFFAFLSIVEFGVILSIEFHEKRDVFKNTVDKSDSTDVLAATDNTDMKKMSLSEKIDRLCMVLSALGFFAFNIWYWVTYL